MKNVIFGVFVAVTIAVGASKVTAQDDNNPPSLPRFQVVATQPLSYGVVSVVKDRQLANQPCFYLYESATGVSLVPTPGGICVNNN